MADVAPTAREAYESAEQGCASDRVRDAIALEEQDGSGRAGD